MLLAPSALAAAFIRLHAHAGVGDDSGWKQVHGDVFRRPAHVVLYSAFVGTGTQLLLLALIVVVAAFAGSLYVDRGAVTRAAVVVYSLTSAVSGFISGRFYRSYFLPDESPHWIRVMLLTASLFPGLLFGMLVVLNLVAWAYATTNALTFLTILKIVSLLDFCVVMLLSQVCHALMVVAAVLVVGFHLLAAQHRWHHPWSTICHVTQDSH